MNDYTISPPDFSRLDFEVRKTVAKHELLFAIEMITREKISEDEPIFFRVMQICNKAKKLALALNKFKQVCMSNYTQQIPTASISSPSKRDVRVLIKGIEASEIFKGDDIINAFNNLK